MALCPYIVMVWLIRLEEAMGELLEMRWGPLCLIMHALHQVGMCCVELFAILRRLQICAINGIRKMMITMDSKLTVEILLKYYQCPCRVLAVIDKITFMLANLEDHMTIHIWREAN